MDLKRLLILGSLVLLLAAIPLTVYYSQQRQQTQSQAQKSTTLCFAPTSTTTSNPTCSSAPITKAPGETFSVDVIMNPGSNTVSTVRLNIVYDATKIATSGAGITPNASAVSPLTDTTYTNGNATARLGIVVNPAVGVDVTKTLSQPTKIATIEFKVLNTATPGTASITFGQTLVLSANQQDGQDEDVLSSTTPITVAIGAAATSTPGVTQTASQAPLCTSLNVDRTTSGPAPYSITFTVNGRDPDGTVQKVTFNFGDGPVQDVIQNGGIGTNSVSVQTAHTYNNPGTYTATATLTDSSGIVSVATPTCTQNITVTAGSSSTSSGSSSAQPTQVLGTTPTDAPIADNTTPTAIPTLKPGPGDTLVGVGAIGLIITIVGGLLLFAL